MKITYPNMVDNKVSHQHLAIIVTGMEHSGTTFLSNMLSNSFSNVGGAFECGLLLSKNHPKDFILVEPFYDWFCLSKEIGHWGLTKEERNFIVSTTSWDVAYDRLLKTYAKNEKGKKIEKLIDKTPAYCYDLNKIIKRTSSKIPIFVTIKNIYSLFYSFKKRGVNILQFILVYARFIKSLYKVRDNKRVFLFKHEDVVNNPNFIFEYLKHYFPPIKDDVTGYVTDLNYNLNPLKIDYDIEKERYNALKNINIFEKKTLDLFYKILNLFYRYEK